MQGAGDGPGASYGRGGTGGLDVDVEIFLRCSRYELLKEPDGTSLGDTVGVTFVAEGIEELDDGRGIPTIEVGGVHLSLHALCQFGILGAAGGLEVISVTEEVGVLVDCFGEAGFHWGLSGHISHQGTSSAGSRTWLGVSGCKHYV